MWFLNFYYNKHKKGKQKKDCAFYSWKIKVLICSRFGIIQYTGQWTLVLPIWSIFEKLESSKKFSITQPAFTCSKLAIETLEQRCEICSKLTIKTPKRSQWRRFAVFIVNFEHISHLCSSASIVSFEHVIAGWEKSFFSKF